MIVLISLIVTFFVSCIASGYCFMSALKNGNSENRTIVEIIVISVLFLTVYVANVITLELILMLWGKI